MGKVKKEKSESEMSRTEIIINEIESGGFTEEELNQIIDICYEAINNE